MLDKLERRMTPEEFYAWQETIDERYELVDGYPVKMMTGASRRHDQIVVNLIGEIGRQLRGSACRPFTADTAVRTFPATRRRPDAVIEVADLGLTLSLADIYGDLPFHPAPKLVPG
jgi:Uma2 family endonuclease